VQLFQSLLVSVVLQLPHIQTQVITAGNPVLQQLLQMVEQHQFFRWHLVVLVATEILAAHQQVNMFQAAVVVPEVLVTEQPAASVSTQISLAQDLCMAVVALDQMDLQEVHLKVAEAMAIHQQPMEVAEAHRPRPASGLHLQVRMAL
jgi:hypothetical protein